MDAYVRSQYFYKDRDAKISAGPLWDYDLTFDVGGFFDNRNIQGWQHQQSAVRNGVNNTWFQRLLTDPAFTAQVVARWKSLRQGLLSDAQVDARINMLTAGLANAAARNFARWPILTDARASARSTHRPSRPGKRRSKTCGRGPRPAWPGSTRSGCDGAAPPHGAGCSRCQRSMSRTRRAADGASPTVARALRASPEARAWFVGEAAINARAITNRASAV